MVLVGRFCAPTGMRNGQTFEEMMMSTAAVWRARIAALMIGTAFGLITTGVAEAITKL